MNRQRLLEHLNELLLIERFAAESYPQYAQQARDPEIKAMLRQFGVDSEKHRDILGDLITNLGGHASRVTEIAAFTAAWTKGFADVLRRSATDPTGNLRDLLLAEYWDRLDWQILAQVADDTKEPNLVEAVRRVLPDEEKHVSMLEEWVQRLAFDHITGANEPVPVTIPVRPVQEWQPVRTFEGGEPGVMPTTPPPVPPDPDTLTGQAENEVTKE